MTHDYIEIVHTTQKALLVKFDKGNCWIPKAMIEKLEKNQVEIYDNFTFKFLPKEENIVDMFDEIEKIEDSPKIKETKKKIKKVKEKIKDFISKKDDLNWLLNPDFKFKKIKVYKNH